MIAEAICEYRPPGDIASRGLHRDEALSGIQAVGKLYFELVHAVELRLCEIPHPRMGELDIAL